MSVPLQDYERLKALLRQEHYAPNLNTLVTRACEEIESLREKLDCQSAVLAEALKAKNDALAQLDTECYRQQNLSQEVRYLQQELAKLKPPEPKFRVSQVVRYGHGFYQISSMRTNAITSSKWEYQMPFVGWVFETDLRALTDEEK